MYIMFIVQCKKFKTITEKSVILIDFKDVLCHVCTYIVTVISFALHKSGIRKALLGPCQNNAEVY